MRLAGIVLFVGVLAGGLAAQDTNFSAGPQYLVTTSSPLFLHPITTPSMSLDAAPAASEYVEEASTQEVTAPPPGRSRNDLYLPSVLWGEAWVQHVTGENQFPSVEELEISAPEATPPLPPSIAEFGVIRMVDAQSLHASGYGMTLGAVSAYWKARHHVPRVYTNADIARLHGS